MQTIGRRSLLAGTAALLSAPGTLRAQAPIKRASL